MTGALLTSLADRPLAVNEPHDGALLERFVQAKDDDAFALLAARHGRLVYGAARRLLGHAADADDVCQAAFLLLARKAPGLCRERSLAGWLVGVVRRLASDVRKSAKRRRRREATVALTGEAPGSGDASLVAEGQEVARLLDDELATLPRKYREPLLLCCLQGLPKAVVATRLGWPEGTVSGRVARGKQLLRSRLERRGVVPSVALALLGGAAQTYAAPTLLTPSVYRIALLEPVRLKSSVPAGVFILYQGASAMWLSHWKLAAAAVLAVLSLAWLGGGLFSPSQAQETHIGGGIESRPLQPGADDAKQLQGQWHCVAMILGGGVPDAARAEAEREATRSWFRFSGDKIEISGSPSENRPVPYKLNTSVSPKQIDIQAGAMTLKGIYVLEAGMLLVRFNESPEGERPTSLAVDAKSPGATMVFQRERPRAAADKGGPGNLGRQAQATGLAALQQMRQIGLAQHMYLAAPAADGGGFPSTKLATNICDQNGKPLLSWRVRLLPYLEQDHLYKQFKLDEPWDGPTNSKLLKQMPGVFSGTGKTNPEGTTPFRMFVGKGAFENGKDYKMSDIADGTSNTILFVEAAESVPWTKPDDLTYDANQPLPKLGQLVEGRFLACFCDGSVHSIARDVKPEVLRKLITINDGELIQEKEWEK